MDKKVRAVFVVDEEIRDTLRLEAALQGKDMADVVADLVREHFAGSLAQIRARRTKDKKASKKNGGDA